MQPQTMGAGVGFFVGRCGRRLGSGMSGQVRLVNWVHSISGSKSAFQEKSASSGNWDVQVDRPVRSVSGVK